MTEHKEINHLVDHLFRHETGKLVSVLTRILGPENLELARDVVQDALVEAISQWEFKGVPDNPSAWLFMVAKNKALNILNREKYRNSYSSEMANELQSEQTAEAALNNMFSEEEILDDQLRMIFTCCHPSISPDSQIALALKTLCGFSIPEIAKAFLTTEENINKRLVRARQKIRENKIPFEVPKGGGLEKRLQTVLETIYLLFNEGYSASKGDEIIRYELCEEAIRLAQIIVEHPGIERKENVYALLSLMFLNASRFKAREDSEGNLLTLAEQNRSLWNRELRGNGLYYLDKAAKNGSISAYHVLAAISAQHCIAPDYESTDWRGILELYGSLLQFDNSPVVLLNRAIALSKVEGAEKALAELERIEDNSSIKSYHLFYSTQAEFFMHLNQFDKAIDSLQKALKLTSVKSEKALLDKKINGCRDMLNQNK